MRELETPILGWIADLTTAFGYDAARTYVIVVGFMAVEVTTLLLTPLIAVAFKRVMR